MSKPSEDYQRHLLLQAQPLRPTDESNPHLQYDWEGYLSLPQSKEKYPHKLRMVQIWDEEQRTLLRACRLRLNLLIEKNLNRGLNILRQGVETILLVKLDFTLQHSFKNANPAPHPLFRISLGG